MPMNESEITDRDRAMAQWCVECPVCTRARRNQHGVAFWFVKQVEGSVCPFCQAYEKSTAANRMSPPIPKMTQPEPPLQCPLRIVATRGKRSAAFCA
jgi:hypothetical protein